MPIVRAMFVLVQFCTVGEDGALGYSGLDGATYQENGKKRAFATAALVIVNIAVWAVLEIMGDTFNGAYIMQYGGLYPEMVINGREWYRLFTAMFLHFGVQHLANNMILLAAAGSILERAAGHLKYLVIYLGAGISGSVLSLYCMLRTGDYAVCAGASGAVFGVIGALIWVAILNKGKFEGLSVKGLLLMVALCLYNGATTVGVDNWAHVGGAAGGFFLCILFYRKP